MKFLSKIYEKFKSPTKKQIMIEILKELQKLNLALDSVIGSGKNYRNTSNTHIRVGDWEKNRY
jgi:hypothetical protein